MFTKSVYRKARFLCLGLLLATWGSLAVAAEWMYGQVTSINLERNIVVIDGRALTLSASEKLSKYHQLKEMKPGQAVRYELVGTSIQRIESVQLPPT